MAISSKKSLNRAISDSKVDTKHLKYIIEYYFDEGKNAAMASHTPYHGFDREMIEAKKKQLVNELNH